jgi:hypothetical protein
VAPSLARPALAGALLAALLAPAAARPGVLIETETRDPRQPQAPALHGRIWIDGPKLRLETLEGDDDDARVAIFRGDRDLLWTLDPDGRHYAQIDRDALDQLGEARREMRRRLEALPPEQRAALERMLRGNTPDRDEAPLELEETDEEVVLGDRRCRAVALHRDGQERGQVCTVGFGDVGVPRRELRVFRSLARFQRSLIEVLGAPPGGDLGRQPFQVFDRLGGFPLRTQRIEDGSVVSETLFTRVERADPDDSLFELPEGATPREPPFLSPQASPSAAGSS